MIDGGYKGGNYAVYNTVTLTRSKCRIFYFYNWVS
jgi:hypothetical protein